MSKRNFLASFKSDFFSNPKSKLWDEKVTTPELQKLIARSKSVQAIYAYTESKLTRNVAQLIDIKTSNAVQLMGMNDYLNTTGFSQPQKASVGQKNYLDITQTLRFLIWNDVTHHSARDAQLHAYRRWIGVAELLLKKGNYEGALLVISNLSEIDTNFQLAKDLTYSYQKHLVLLIKLISPPFKKLCDYMEKHKSSKDITPIVLLSRSLTYLDELLGESHNLTTKLVSKEHPAYALLMEKEKILSGIKFNKEAQGVPPELDAIYAEADVSFSNARQWVAPQARNPARASIFSTKAPSFWKRKLNLDDLHHFVNLENTNQRP